MGARTLRVTLTGQDVRDLQTALARLGYYDERRIDGIFGSSTAAGVIALQAAAGIKQDGVCGPDTWAALAAATTHQAPRIADVVAPSRTEDHPEGDPGAPYLLFDLYPPDLDKASTPEYDVPPFAAVAARPHYVGGILKASDGLGWGARAETWFRASYPALQAAGGDRYGTTWLRGAYHFLEFLQDGAKQAAYYLAQVAAAGGRWDDPGQIMPIVDIELGGERNPNRRATAAQIVACASAFAETVKKATGRGCILYGRGAMRDLLITSRMSCTRAWNPSYTAEMAMNGLTVVDGKPGPWTPADVVLWQYGGDGTGDQHVHHLPLEIVGFGKVDVSAHVTGTPEAATLATLRAALI